MYVKFRLYQLSKENRVTSPAIYANLIMYVFAFTMHTIADTTSTAHHCHTSYLSHDTPTTTNAITFNYPPLPTCH